MTGASSPRPVSQPGAALPRDHDRTIGRILTALTYVAVVLLASGVALMLLTGVSPLAGWPPLDLPALPGQLLAAAPAGFLWLGLLAVITTPIVRVLAAAVAYASGREWPMVGVSFAILAVIALAVASASTSPV